MSVALTVQDVEQLHATGLKLVHRKLQTLPQGLGKLTSLTSLDASDNPITGLLSGELPPNLKELNLTGCQLTAIPQCLTSLSNLQHLQLSANRITQADAAFKCPYLLHAGLGYNHISSIPVSDKSASPSRSATPQPGAGTSSTPSSPAHSKRPSLLAPANGSPSSRDASPAPQRLSTARQDASSSISRSPTTSSAGAAPGCSAGSRPSSIQPQAAAVVSCRSPIMSLDLSHNDITDLPATLQQLQQLSQLKSLSMKGNPVSLLPTYQQAVVQQLTQLIYLDGQKLDGITTTGGSSSSSRPGSAAVSRRRPGSARPTSARSQGLAAAGQQQQQQSLIDAFSSMLSPAEPIPVPLLLELSKVQLVESSAQVFADLAELSTDKQQSLQQQMQQEADAAAAAAAAEAAAAAAANASPAVSMSGGKGKASSSGSSSGARGADAAAEAAAVQAPTVEVPIACLKPLTYHLQLTAPDGSEICSTALVIQPPAGAPDKAALAAAEASAAAAAAAAAAGSKKGKGGKAAKPDSKAAATATAGAAAKGKPGAKGVKGRASTDDSAVASGSASQQMVPGYLKVLLQLPVTVAGRDWIRQGFSVELIRTHHEPEQLLQQPAAVQKEPSGTAVAAAAAKAGKAAAPAGKTATGTAAATGAATEFASSYSWQYSMKQQVLGTAKVTAAELLESSGRPEQQTSDGTADFMPAPPLFNPVTNTLMLLKEAKANLKSVGSCRYKLVLHYSGGEQ